MKLKALLLLFPCFWIAVEAKGLTPDRFVTTVGATYASEYLTDGFRIGDASPVLQTMLKLDIPSTHFSLMYWNSLRAVRSKKEYDEHDFFLMYSSDFKSESRYAFNFHGFYDYWYYPNTRPTTDLFGDKLSHVEKHGSKVNAGISMNKLLPLAGSYLVPAYNVYYWIYWADDRKDQYQGGARHELSLSYSHALPQMASWIKSQYAGAFASVSYNDGAFKVRPGMSHSLGTLYAGISALGMNFSVSLNQQFSHQRTVNRRNDFWTTIGAFKEF